MSDSDTPTWREWLDLYSDVFGVVGGVVLVASVVSIVAGWLVWPWLLIPLSVATTLLCVYIFGRVFISNNAPLNTLGPIEHRRELTTPAPTLEAAVLPAKQVASLSPASEVHHEAKPNLKGQILCLNTQFVMNTWQDRIMMSSKWYDHGYDCALTFQVRINSDSAMPTVVTRFSLVILGLQYPYSCDEVPVDGYFVERKMRMMGGPPHKRIWKPLKAFPLNAEVTNTIDQEGWLRFHCSVLVPPDREDFSNKQLRLVAFDGKRQPHTIYEGTPQLPACENVVDAAHRTDDPWM